MLETGVARFEPSPGRRVTGLHRGEGVLACKRLHFGHISQRNQAFEGQNTVRNGECRSLMLYFDDVMKMLGNSDIGSSRGCEAVLSLEKIEQCLAFDKHGYMWLGQHGYQLLEAFEQRQRFGEVILEGLPNPVQKRVARLQEQRFDHGLPETLFKTRRVSCSGLYDIAGGDQIEKLRAPLKKLARQRRVRCDF